MFECSEEMYEAFKKSLIEASDSEAQRDVYMNAIEAAVADHVTRLQAENELLMQEAESQCAAKDGARSERDALKAEVGRLTTLCIDKDRRMSAMNESWAGCISQRDAMQSELTKARELVRSNATDFEGIRRALAAFHKENQEQWCGYLDDSLGICLYRIKELAAYLAHQSAPAAKGKGDE